MNSFLKLAMFISLGATTVVLLLGIGTLFYKGNNASIISNRLMRLRVMLQGLTIALFILQLLSK